MLRINLLPGYVAERRTGFYVVLGSVFLFGLTVPPLLLYNSYQRTQLKLEQAVADSAEAGKAETDGVKAEAARIAASAAPILQRLSFVKSVRDSNIAWVRLYSKLADYTDSKITYSDAVVNGASVGIRAYTPSTADVARYLQALYQDPDFSSVAIDRIPGWGQAFEWKYYLDGKLIAVSTAADPGKGVPGLSEPGASDPSRGAESPPPGFGGAGNPPPGFGGGTVGMASPRPGGERVYSIQEVLGKQINPFATAGARQLQIRRALRRVVRKQVPRGFDISVTATLVKPLSPPGMPGAASPSVRGEGNRPAF